MYLEQKKEEKTSKNKNIILKLKKEQLESILTSDLTVDIADMSEKDLNTYSLDFEDYVLDELNNGMSINFDIFYSRDVRIIKGDRLTPDCEETMGEPVLEIELKDVNSEEQDFLSYTKEQKLKIEEQIKKEAYF